MGKSTSFRRKLNIVLLLSAVVIIITSCHEDVESFSLDCDNPGRIGLTEEPGVKAEREGFFLFDKAFSDGLPSTPLYRPVEEVHVHPDGAFAVEYSSRLKIEAELSFPGETVTFQLPATDGKPVNVDIPLEGRSPTAFRFFSTEGPDSGKGATEAEPLFSLKSVGIDVPVPGLRMRLDRPEFLLGVEGWNSLEDMNSEIVLPKHLAAKALRFHQNMLRIDYSYQEAGTADQSTEDRSYIELEVCGSETGQDGPAVSPANEAPANEAPADKSQPEKSPAAESCETFRLFLNDGEHSVFLYSQELGFSPVRLRTDADGRVKEGQFSLRGIELHPVSMYAEGSPRPLPADIGMILRYDRSNWRRSDWELFSWNLFPSILIIDFMDYRTQAAFLKRLAFFVEKKGFAGQLHSDEVLADLHGWNAHDYRAEDLAAFFSLAEEGDFPLNRAEKRLRRILLDNGIIHAEADGYTAGEGGIISLSQESSPRLRYLFATHEAYHGLYFASEEYRRRVSEIWSANDEREREFWRLFLDWRNYDVEDEYLLENEFQAYLMQQHLSHVGEYFEGYIIPRFIELFPQHEDKMRGFLDDYPDYFIDMAERVEEAAREIAGITAGDLVCLRPALP